LHFGRRFDLPTTLTLMNTPDEVYQRMKAPAGCMRRKMLKSEDARALQVQVEAEHLLAGNEHEVDSQGVLELVQDGDCSE